MNNARKHISDMGFVPAWIAAAQDLFFSALSSLLAILALRLVSDPIPAFSGTVLRWVGLSALATFMGISVTKCHKTVRRYANYQTILRVLATVLIKEALLFVAALSPLLSLPALWNYVVVFCFDFILTSAFLVYTRIVARFSQERQHIKKQAGQKTALVVWAGEPSVIQADELERSCQYQVLGFLSQDQNLSGRRIGERVIFWAQTPQQFKTLQWKLGGVDTVIFPTGGEFEDVARREAETENEVPHNDKMSLEGNMVKRAFDIGASSVLMVLFSPVIAACALAIWLEDGGNCIYRQERIGRGGKPFYIYKFRTMRPDAEKAGPALYSGAQDHRLTRVGAFLRTHHLDELPQLWNVLRGDMSFIGHRPERQYYIDQIMAINPRYSYLYQIRPGVTSYATLYNGYTDTLEKMLTRLDLDLYYLRNRSVWFDVKIMVLTFLNVAVGKKI